MAKKSDLFSNEKEDQTTYSFKIPKSLRERIDNVSARLERVSQGQKFQINRILQREMEDAVSLAESELETMERTAGVSGSGRTEERKEQNSELQPA